MRKFKQSYVLSAIVEHRIEKYFHLVSFNVNFGILAIHVKPTAILNAFPWNQSSADMRTTATVTVRTGSPTARFRIPDNKVMRHTLESRRDEVTNDWR
jgi:hypothetical protein